MHLDLTKKDREMSTCNWLVLETLGSQLKAWPHLPRGGGCLASPHPTWVGCSQPAGAMWELVPSALDGGGGYTGRAGWTP